MQPQLEVQPLHPLQALQPQPEQQRLQAQQQQRLQVQQSQQLTFCATIGSPQPQFVMRSETQLLQPQPKLLIPPNTHAIENPSHKMSRGIAPTGPSYVEARHLVRSAGSGDGVTYSV